MSMFHSHEGTNKQVELAAAPHLIGHLTLRAFGEQRFRLASHGQPLWTNCPNCAEKMSFMTLASMALIRHSRGR